METKRSAKDGRGPHRWRKVFAQWRRGRCIILIRTVEPCLRSSKRTRRRRDVSPARSRWQIERTASASWRCHCYDNENTNPVPQYLGGPIQQLSVLNCTACSRIRARAVAQMLTNVVKFVANAPTAEPHQVAMPHGRFGLVAGQDVEQPQTATHHTEVVSMRHGTDHAANNGAICSKPSKSSERCLNERQRGSRAFLCVGKPVTHKEGGHVIRLIQHSNSTTRCMRTNKDVFKLCHGDAKPYVKRQENMEKCFHKCCSTMFHCVSGALTSPRHHDTVRQLQRRRTRKEHKALAPWE